MTTTENKAGTGLQKITPGKSETETVRNAENIAAGLSESPVSGSDEIFSIGMGFTIRVTNYKRS